MHGMQEVASRTVCRINEIQPYVSMSGMDDVTEILGEIKKDMLSIVATQNAEHKTHPILASMKNDIDGTYVALAKEMFVAKELDDSPAGTRVRLAAELLLMRYDEYVSVRQKILGGKHA